MSRFWLTFSCCFLGVTLLAQDKKIDSLKRVLRHIQNANPSFSKDTQTIVLQHKLSLAHYYYPDYKTAIHYANQALELSKKIAWHKGQIMSYEDLSRTKFKLGQTYESIQLAYQSLTLSEKTNSLNSKLIALRLIADYFSTLNQKDSAIYYYKKLIKIHETQKNTKELGACYLNLATTLKTLPDADPVPFFKKAETLFTTLQNDFWLGNLYYSWGDYLIVKNQFEAAYDYLEKAIVYFKKSGSESDLAGPYQELAYLYVKKRDFNNAIVFSQKSLELSAPIQSLEDMLWAYESLFNAYKGLKDYKKALEFHEKYLGTKIQLLSNDTQKQLNLYRQQYDNEREIHQKTIDNQTLTQQQQQTTLYFLIGILVMFLALVGLLLWNNRTLRKKNAEIQEAHFTGQTTERKRVAAELHDNLGSQLSAMRWSMLAMNKNILTPHELEIYDHILKMMNESYDQVRNMSHHLLPEELEKEGLLHALATLTRQLNRNKKIKFELKIPDLFSRLDKKIEFELYSILLELINNIIKHSKASAASISFSSRAQNLQIEVSDNGQGIPQEVLNHGRGLRNIQQRIKELNGTFTVQTSPNGTHFVIVLEKIFTIVLIHFLGIGMTQ
ncbi:tetratricopeptide repeat-containing sensor histidine kinase [Runella zeae]|uniref:tetratricopeptide repeat-containing sensor histidine kinase n=1 Tax=Runella zeae TaxID=94255 RepID=UPI00040EC518|nr:tetratricopeptide repeat-containing sensor histidine kinase [Runella zeae]